MSTASMSPRIATSAVLVSAANRFLVGTALSATDSISVFQAPQPGHLPSHLGLASPQSLQMKVVFVLAIAGCYWVPLLRLTLPQHVVAQLLTIQTQLAQGREFFLEDFIGMRLLVFLKRPPIGHDRNMLFGRPGSAQRSLVRNKTGELKYLTCDESTFISAVSIFHDVAHLGQRQLDIIKIHVGFDGGCIEKHFRPKGNANRRIHDNLQIESNHELVSKSYLLPAVLFQGSVHRDHIACLACAHVMPLPPLMPKSKPNKGV